MATYDRAWLRSQIGNYLHDNTTGLEDTFIDIAAAKIGMKLESRENQYTYQVAISGEDYAMPDEWVSVRLVEFEGVGGLYPLRSIPTHQLNLYGNPSGGQPIVYAAYGDGRLRPRPFADGTYNITVWTKVPIGPDPEDTNDALGAYPFIFLSAALAEGFDYKQDLQMIARWTDKWLAEVEEVNKVSRKLDASDAPAMRAM